MTRRLLPKTFALRTKAILVVLLIITLMLAANATAVIIVVRRNIANAEQKTAQSMARSLASASELPTTVGDKDELHRLTDAYLWNNDVLFAAILNKQGELIASATNQKDAVTRYLASDTPPSDMLVGHHAVTVVNTFDRLTVFDTGGETALTEEPGRVVGYAVVGLTKTQMHRAQSFMTRLVLSLTALGLFVSLVIVALTVGNWARRLDAIVTATERIRRGDLSVTLVDRDPDEIGQLARAYNLMCGAVQQRDGELRRLNETLQNRVEQRTAELRESEARIRGILQSAVDGILTIEPDGRIATANPAAEKLFGYAIDELIGHGVHELFIPKHRQAADTSPFKKLDPASMPFQIETMGKRKDNTLYPAYVSANVVSLDQRHIFAIVVHDLTEHHRLERQLAQSQKLEAIGHLAAGVAHEINTPIQFVGDNTRFLQDAFDDIHRVHEAYASLLQEVAGTPDIESTTKRIHDLVEEIDMDFLSDEIPRAISQARDGVDRVAKIVRSMKEFAHPGNEGMSAIDLNHAIENTITVARNEWKYVAELITDFDTNLSPVTCLPGELNQVMLNIIVNAAHAIEECNGPNPADKGRITITTAQKGKEVEIQIRDTGNGIPPQVRDRIFDPFFTTKAVGKGTGQGLAIAHNVICDKHKGTLECTSTVGEGTCFVIKIPITPQRESSTV